MSEYGRMMNDMNERGRMMNEVLREWQIDE
jgi:hypothetical protein